MQVDVAVSTTKFRALDLLDTVPKVSPNNDQGLFRILDTLPYDADRYEQGTPYYPEYPLTVKQS